MDEEWRDIPGFEGRYQVSNLGRVKSLPREVSNYTGKLLVKEKILKQRHDFKGYMRIDLKDNTGKHRYLGVHRLVALAFIPNPDNKPQINHIDGNKENNMLNNLEWVNNSENQLHAYRTGLSHVSEKAGKPKKAVLQISVDTNEVIEEFESLSDAKKKFGDCGNIAMCCKNKRRTAYGYKWKYKDYEYKNKKCMIGECENDEYLRQEVEKLKYLSPPSVRQSYMIGQFVDFNLS